MKKALFLIIFSSYLLFGQNSFKKAEVSFGDSAFTSGLNLATEFNVGKNKEIEVVGNSERFFGVLSYVTQKLDIEASGGVFKELPWVGPRIIYRPHNRLMFLYWGGVSPGRVGDAKKEIKSFFQQGTFYTQVHKNLSLGYTIIKFDIYKTNHLPEIGLSKKITDKVTVKFSATYDINESKPLYMVSLLYQHK